MRAEDRRGLHIHAFLLFVTLAVTAVVALLLVPGSSQTGVFYPFLFAILALEVVGFLFPAFLASRGRRSSGTMRINLGISVFLGVYSVGVLILVLLAFGPGSLSTAVTLQFTWLIFFVFALGANAMGFLGALARRKRAPATAHFDALCDRLRRVDGAETMPLKADFADARDDFEAAVEFLPWSDMADRELSACLERMDRELVTLEAAANPRNIVAASVPVPEAVSSLGRELKRMRRALKRM